MMARPAARRTGSAARRLESGVPYHGGVRARSRLRLGALALGALGRGANERCSARNSRGGTNEGSYKLEEDPRELRNLYAPDHGVGRQLRERLLAVVDGEVPSLEQVSPEEREHLRALGYL